MNRLDDFQQQFKFGQEKEREILNIFRRAGWIGDLFNFKSFGDLWVIKERIPYVIEIKDEDRYSESKNICIELYQGINRKPSGISLCESQICIHTFKIEAAIYRTQFMRLHISRNKNKFNPAKFQKADNYNGGLIISKEHFRKFNWFEFCKLNELPESKVFTYEF